MDVLFDNDLDNNNNVVLNNDNQNLADLNAPLVNEVEQNMNDNMENIHENVGETRDNGEDIDHELHLLNNVQIVNNNPEYDEGDASHNEGTSNESNKNVTVKVENMENETRNDVESGQNVSNLNSLNARKSKKRKRHYNINKNKKWNKSYKRQKSSNIVKSDAENVLQSNRNKHPYTKAPKIIFNNKQAMHRGSGLSKFFLPDKRPRKDIIVPPTKFLLGGNISDPLNLNSLQDEALVSMSAVTPKSSPITTPPKVEVIIPPNIFDPLHLLDPVDSIEYEKQLVSPLKTRRLNKQRSKKKKMKKCSLEIPQSEKIEVKDTFIVSTTHSDSLPKSVGIPNEIEQPILNPESEVATSCINDTENEEKVKLCRDLQLDLSTSSTSVRKRKFSESGSGSNVNSYILGNGNGNASKKLRRFDSKDKIVSPVIPQPGAWKRPPKVLLGAPRNRMRTISASDNLDETKNKKIESIIYEEMKPEKLRTAIRKPESPPDPALQCFETCINAASTSNSTCNVLNQESVKYQFGNYVGQYCGLQTLMNLSDVRLTVFLRHAYLFKDKDILDIGCNVGHMTIAVASKLHPKSIVGVDIDKDLIARARRNLSAFQRIPESELRDIIPRPRTKGNETVTQSESNSEMEKISRKIRTNPRIRIKEPERHDSIHPDFFPLTFPICFGGLPNIKHKIESPSSSPASSSQNMKTSEHSEQQDLKNKDSVNNEAKSRNRIQNDVNTIINTFPENVFFRTLNYAVVDESQLLSDKQDQYDLILCLSLTKWIHLNFGDAGLKLTFRRMFNQLRPGGKLILEAQNWASYKKRKKLTPTIFNNYKNIEFFPNNFHEYLLSPEVGFSHSYTLGVPRHASKGFYRPIQLYIKGDFTPSQVRWSDTYHPQTPYEPMVGYAHYVDPMRITAPFSSHLHFKMSNMYKRRDTPFTYSANRYNTPSHGISSSTSRYYNPLETDSYLPSYDNVVQTRHYCFASPLYSTVWSPPASGRKSASQTPLFGSIRRVDSDEQDVDTKHVYLTPRAFDGGGSSRSIDESNSASPKTHHVYAIGSSRSVREQDLDTNTSSPKHVYAFQ